MVQNGGACKHPECFDKCLLMLQHYDYFVVKIFVSNKYVKIWVDCSLHGNTNSKELMFYKPNNIKKPD